MKQTTLVILRCLCYLATQPPRSLEIIQTFSTIWSLIGDTTLTQSTGHPSTLPAIKINVLLFYLRPCVFFEPFRRDLNEAKSVYTSEYYLIRRFVIITRRLRLRFRVTSLTINSRCRVNICLLTLCNYDCAITSNVVNYQLPSGERRRKQTRDKTKTRPVLFWCLNPLIQNKIF